MGKRFYKYCGRVSIIMGGGGVSFITRDIRKCQWQNGQKESRLKLNIEIVTMGDLTNQLNCT